MVDAVGNTSGGIYRESLVCHTEDDTISSVLHCYICAASPNCKRGDVLTISAIKKASSGIEGAEQIVGGNESL